jgi:hypothetical protein
MEMRSTFAKMKKEEKAEQSRIRAEERAAEHKFAEALGRKEPSGQKEPERP